MSIPGDSYSVIFDSPVGRLGAMVAGNRLHRLDYLDTKPRRRAPRSRFEKSIVRQLDGYFDDPKAAIRIECALAGTPFQRRVWQALTTILPGETLTYGELAERLGTGARAVGNACRANPVSIIVPCHRVVSATGIGGYSGQASGMKQARKRWLLAHESCASAALKYPRSPPDWEPDSKTHNQMKRNTSA